jgi:lysozyme
MSSVKGVCAPSDDPNEMLMSRVVEHEGIKQFAYQDSLGFWTIGVGRCIHEGKGRGLTTDECFCLLKNDLIYFRNLLLKYDWFTKQDVVRQNALVELAFNLGVNNLLGFKNMISALSVNNYALASKELVESTWARQIGKNRAADLQHRILTGRYK